MKLSTIYTLFFILLLAAVSMSNRGGRASSQNWGNTGAPGDQTLGNGQPRTCQNCHNSSAIQVALDIAITDDQDSSIAMDGYVPGETYNVKVTINPEIGTPAGYGFQMLALNGEEGVDAAEVSTWSDLGSNVKSAMAAFTNRTYVEHNGMSTSNEFLMKWTAPADLTGPVTFYAAGNGVNDNRSTSGDGGAIGRLTIPSNITSSTNFISATSLKTFPNPVRDQLSVQTPIAGLYDFRIYDLSGRMVYQGKIDLPGNNSVGEIDLSLLYPGAYILHMVNDENQFTKRLMKQ